MLHVSEDEIRWRGGIPGVFQGEHYFHLHTTEGVAVLDHGEKFTGVIGVPVVRWLRPIVDAAYRREAAALTIAADPTRDASYRGRPDHVVRRTDGDVS